MLEGRRHLQGAESAHIPFPNASFGCEGPRDLLFVVAAVDVLHQEFLLLERLQNHLLQLLANFLHMVLVFLAEDVVLRQVPLHPLGVGESS
jgi:hypothetical protein